MVTQPQKGQAMDVLADLFAKDIIVKLWCQQYSHKPKKTPKLSWITEPSGEPSQMPENPEQLSCKLTSIKPNKFSQWGYTFQYRENLYRTLS